MHIYQCEDIMYIFIMPSFGSLCIVNQVREKCYKAFSTRLLMYSSRFVNPSESLSLFLSSASLGFNPLAVSQTSDMPSLSESVGAGRDFSPLSCF